MIYDIVTSTVHSVPYYARGVCIQREAEVLPDGFRIATEEEILAAFPPTPEVEVVPEYKKTKIVEAIIAMGTQDVFAAKLATAGTKIQLRYGAYDTLKADDPDFIEMMNELQVEFGMTDEQKDSFLESCLV